MCVCVGQGGGRGRRGVRVRVSAGCKESDFLSLAFGQAEASIY